MFNKRKNLKRIVITSLAAVMVLSSAAFGASKIYKKQITATYGRVKFNYNGTDVTSKIESSYGTPGFIGDDNRAYIPVRAVADVLGVDVNWDYTTHTAFLTASEGNLEFLQQQISRLQAEKAVLEQKIKDLEGNSSSDKSIGEVERNIRKDYEDYEKVSFDIRLRGNDRRADLEITTDLGNRRNKDNWDDLKERDVERFVERIIDDIQREFKDCDIKGYIRDSDAREDLYTFRKDGDRRLEFDKEKDSNSDDKDLVKDLEKRYDSLKKVKDMTFKLEKNSRDDYTVTVKVDFDEYEKEWDRIDDDDLEEYMSDVQSYITKYSSDYKKADIEVKMESKSGRIELASYSASGDRKSVV